MAFQPHKWIKRRWSSYPMCAWCGLVLLRNSFTAWCKAHGCDHEDHPDFTRQLRLATEEL